jgi:hypothetical protein
MERVAALIGVICVASTDWPAGRCDVEDDGAIQIESLPAYAPELNPTEYIGGDLKTREIANLCARQLEPVRGRASRRLRSIRRRTTSVEAFWKQADLAF